MATYEYPDDGNLHTRYSELSQCLTPAGAYAVAEQKLGIKGRYENEVMAFGTTRHEMWEDEGKETGMTPACFADNLEFQRFIVETEQHRATEIFKGVIFHFTVDAVVLPEQDAPHAQSGDHELVDYKTATLNGRGGISVDYSRSVQLPTYALLSRPHGYNVKRGHYLIECWNRERTKLEGYRIVTKDIGLREMAEAKKLLKQGTQNLMNAMTLVAKHNGIK